MSKRIFTEEHLAGLPASMTKRALASSGTTKKGAQVAEHLAGVPAAKSKSAAGGGMAAMQALGRLKKGELNDTEEAYRAHLDLLRMAGEVLWYQFEPFRLVLADNTTYRPDFLVQVASGHLEVHEVKGRWMDDARVKIKVAAAMFPVFKFIAIQKVGGTGGKDPTWKVEEF